MEIPFHRPYITDEEIAEVVDSLRSGWLTMGPKTVRFEADFAKYVGSKHSVAMNSCTAALHLALRAIHLQQSNEVIIPTMTFTATGEVIAYFNANPVIIDVERDNHTMDALEIEKAITPRTKAIIPVHYGGQPCDMGEIMDIAAKYHLSVIEDAAHSLPAWYKGRKIGTIGDITCFSFYATKTLSTGEGGMATTETDEWADTMRILRLHGISTDAWKRYTNQGSWYYEVIEAGYKYNTTDIQAGIGLAQLKKLEWMWMKRKDIAEKYSYIFKTSEFILCPLTRPDTISAWHLYVIKLNLEALRIDRNRFIEELKLRGIGTSVHFIPLHRHPYYRSTFSLDIKDFPNAEWIYERSISLPIYPGMTDGEVNYVGESVLDLCKVWKR
jgi:perosamine synthetase